MHLKHYEKEENPTLATKRDSTTHVRFCLAHGIIFKIEKLNVFRFRNIQIHEYLYKNCNFCCIFRKNQINKMTDQIRKSA